MIKSLKYKEIIEGLIDEINDAKKNQKKYIKQEISKHLAMKLKI